MRNAPIPRKSLRAKVQEHRAQPGQAVRVTIAAVLGARRRIPSPPGRKKPFKLVAVALANKMARIAFAILRGKTVYREIPA